jgi:SAM-dependent methyltransferase
VADSEPAEWDEGAKHNVGPAVTTCLCCGSNDLVFVPVLWQSLIEEWRLSAYEADYINRQQGLRCNACDSNLRSMVLALGLMRSFEYEGLFRDFVRLPRVQALRILEINEAGSLTQFLSSVPGHCLRTYPDVDMMRLPYPEHSFDIVVHSDTLEHVTDPVAALAQCCRVLRPSGLCAFTVPIIVDRLTRSRTGLPPSYHGAPKEDPMDYLVVTEYGADVWKHLVFAGFDECRIFSLDYPSAQALVGVRHES